MNLNRALASALGVSVLGLLIRDVLGFATPAFANSLSALPIDRPMPFDAFCSAFVDGKFQAVIAIVMGYWISRRGSSAKTPLWNLAAIGVMHGFLIWEGDLLSTLAVAGLMAVWMLRIEKKGLWWPIVGLALNAAVVAVAVVPVLLYWHHSDLAQEWDLGLISSTFRPHDAIQVFQQGSWMQQFQFRSAYYAIQLSNSLLYAPLVLPLVLLGVQLERIKFLEGSAESMVVRSRLIWIAWIALPLNLIAFLPMSTREANDVGVGITVLMGPMLGIGYFLLLTMVGNRVGLFQSVGRMPVTAYVLQSVICTAAFYSWGAGMFGRADGLQLTFVVLVSWIATFALSQLWMLRRRIGPLEELAGV
jgi:uncharacterized protein